MAKMDKKTKNYHKNKTSLKKPMTSYKIIKQNADGTGKQFQIDDNDGNGLFIILLAAVFFWLIGKLKGKPTTTTTPQKTTTTTTRNINYTYTLTK